MRDKLDFSGLPNEVDLSILRRDISLSPYVTYLIMGTADSPPFLIVRNRDNMFIKHDILQFDELPTPGTLVSIDAEFVSMQQVGTVCEYGTYL